MNLRFRFSRFTLFTAVFGLLASLSASLSIQAQDYFTVVVIPDTQKHVQVITTDAEGPGEFGTQPFRATFGELTGWIVNHRQRGNRWLHL